MSKKGGERKKGAKKKKLIMGITFSHFPPYFHVSFSVHNFLGKMGFHSFVFSSGLGCPLVFTDFELLYLAVAEINGHSHRRSLQSRAERIPSSLSLFSVDEQRRFRALHPPFNRTFEQIFGSWLFSRIKMRFFREFSDPLKGFFP